MPVKMADVTPNTSNMDSLLSILGRGAIRKGLNKRNYVDELKQNLSKITQEWHGKTDWVDFYRTLSNKDRERVHAIMREELMVTSPDVDTRTGNVVGSLKSQAEVGAMISDLDTFINARNGVADETTALAYLMREYLKDQTVINEVTMQLPNTEMGKALARDYADLRSGEAWENFVNQHQSLHATLTKLSDRYKQGTFQRKYIDFLINHSRVNDVRVTIGTVDGANGVYRANSGRIELRSGMDEHTFLRTLMHEATHAYFHKAAIDFRSGVEQNAETRAFMQTAEAMFESVKDKPFDSVRFADVAVDEYGRPYGITGGTEGTGLAEFLAELYSSDKFRQWVTESLAATETAKKTKHPLRTAISRIKELYNHFVNIVAPDLRNKEFAVDVMLEQGFKLFSRSAEISNNTLHLKNNEDDISRAEQDMLNGVRYYTFKLRQVFSEPELVGSARYDEESGTWEFNYRDEEGNAQTEQGLDIDDVMEKALDMDMQVYGRSGIDSPGHFLQNQINRTKMTNPRLAQALENFHKFLTSFLPVHTVDNAMSKIYEFALTFEHYAMNRDALHTWLERALKASGRDPQNAQNILNDIHAKTQTFLHERGLDDFMTLKDHEIAIAELAKHYNITSEQLNDIVYALTAKHRTEQFRDNPGEIDPYTGEHVRSDALVSGFSFKDANGNTVRDDDGSKFLNQLSAEQQTFASLLEERWIAQNNSVLDFELQAGAISRSQYEAQYGLFYAPLRNTDTQATAFYKRALGRTTKAKDPATNYYNFAHARVLYAQHQMKMGQLLDTALTENVQNIIEVNQARFTQTGEGLRKRWVNPNVQDPAVITVWRGDTQYTMRITDPIVARMIRKDAGRDMTGGWAILSAVTRGLSLVRTSLSPTFVPAAFARDLLTAIGNVQSAFRDLGSASLSDAQARDLSQRIPGTALKAAMSILKGNAHGTRSWEYDVFKRAGGGITMNARYDFEQANEWLSSELRTAKDGSTVRIGDGLKRTKDVLKKATEISHAFEDATRFATFMEYLKMKNGGREFANEQELTQFLASNPEIKKAAVTGSKNITGNFEVKGSNIAFRSMYMFFNASMVGLSTTVNMFDSRHGTHGFKFGMMLAGAMLASMALIDADLGDDEDGKSKLSRVNKVGDNLCAYGVCIPIPHEARPITNFVKSAYHVARGDYSVGDAVANVMHGVMQAGSPMQFDGMTTTTNTMHTMLQSLTPTLGQLPLQLATGLNSFGKEIKPEFAYTANGQRIVDAMDWQKSKMSDPEWTKWMAMNLQKFLGIDVSSSEIDHVSQFVLGSIYTSTKKAGQAAMSGASAGEIAYNFAGRSFGMTYDNRAMIDEAKEKIREAKMRMTMGDSVENMTLSTQELKENPQYARLVALEKRLENAERSLRYNGKSYAELYRQKQTGLVTDDLDSILEANEGIDYLTEERREVYGKFYDELNDLLNGE